MKKLITGILLSIVYFMPIFGQDGKLPIITAGAISASGMVPAKLQNIDRLLKQAIDSNWTNAAVGLVIRNGRIAYYKNFGYNDIELKKPMQKDAIFRIASQTKAITSVAVMMLFEEGKFLLDDPISKYIPSFKNATVLDKFNEKDTSYTTVPTKREITIGDLLTHTSGIAYPQIEVGSISAIYHKNGIISGLGLEMKLLSDVINRLGSLPLLHQPGEKFTYGLNVDVLGYLVEVVSGMSLDDFLHHRIFEPLGMKDTYFYVPSEKQHRLANVYLFDKDARLEKSPGYFTAHGEKMMDYPKAKGTYFSGGAGLSSTIMDYAIFLQMLLNDGTYNGKKLLSRNTVRMMTMNQIGDLSVGSGPYKFGLGFQIVTENANGILPVRTGTYSWGGFFATTYWVDPVEKIVGLLYKQLPEDAHEYELADKFKVLVYSAIKD